MKNVKLVGVLSMIALACCGVRAGGVPCISSSLLGNNLVHSFLQDIVYDGDTAFRGRSNIEGPVFGLFDVSDPLDHQLIAGVDLPGFVHGFEIQGSYAYLCIYQYGLYIYDISDVNNMVELGHVDLEFPVQDVVVHDGVAYVASKNTLYAIDVADPLNPVVVDSSTESSRVYELVLHNGAVYGASTDGVFRFDLLGGGMFDPAVVVGPVIGALSLIIENDILYANAQASGVFIADISDPDNPITLAMHDTDGSAHNVKKIGDRLYVSDRTNGLVVIDVQDPSAPRTLGRYELPFEAWSAAVDPIRGIVFASGDHTNEGAEVFDVSGIPVNGVLDYRSTSNGCRSSVMLGSSVILAAGGAIYTMDATDPQRLEPSGSLFPGGTSRDIAINDQTLCVAAGANGLMILDAFDPNNLEVVTTLDVPGLADSVFVLGDIAYLGTLTGGISIVDIFDPANPILLSSYDTTSLVREVHVQGQYLYAAGALGLLVFDVSDPNLPMLVYESTLGPGVASLDVDGDTLYLGLSSTGFEVFDISDPTSPAMIVHVDATDRVREIEMHEGILYYTVDNEGLYAVEINAFGQLIERGFVTLDGQLNDLAFDGGRAFLANGLSGVYMLDVTDTCSGCIADLNGDGALDFFDISAFLTAFSDGDLVADFTGDGLLNFFDISAFLIAFSAGCP